MLNDNIHRKMVTVNKELLTSYQWISKINLKKVTRPTSVISKRNAILIQLMDTIAYVWYNPLLTNAVFVSLATRKTPHF